MMLNLRPIRLYEKGFQESCKGIGEYKKTFMTNKLARRVACVTRIVFFTTTCALSVMSAVGSAVCFNKYTVVVFPLAIFLAAKHAASVWMTRKELKGISHLAPSTHNLIPLKTEKSCVKLEEWDHTPMICHSLKDGSQTFLLKKKLVEMAEQEILISGSYCGRKSFDELLDVIENQLSKKPKLRVLILTADRFVTDDENYKSKNWTKLKLLTKKYPDRFITTFSFETYQANPVSGFKITSNHEKLAIFDRKVAITGGSAIEPRWCGGSDGLIEDNDYKKETNVLNASLAKTFRDQDLLIALNPEYKGAKDKKGNIIDRSVIEYYKLFSRWFHYTSTIQKSHPEIKKIREYRGPHYKSTFPIFYQNLRDGDKKIDVDSFIEDQIGREEMTKVNKTRVFSSGPEQSINMLEKRIVKLFNKAKNSIMINHMYFHPTEAVSQALKRALKRGVKVKVLTNQYTNLSPTSHLFFAPRSIHHARDIASVENFKNPRFRLFCWNIKGSTNHTKNIVVDGLYSIVGSSNFGHKSLNPMSDYEHNLEIKSKKLGKVLERQMKNDFDYSVEYDPVLLRIKSGIFESGAAYAHKFFQDFIG